MVPRTSVGMVLVELLPLTVPCLGVAQMVSTCVRLVLAPTFRGISAQARAVLARLSNLSNVLQTKVYALRRSVIVPTPTKDVLLVRLAPLALVMSARMVRAVRTLSLVLLLSALQPRLSFASTVSVLMLQAIVPRLRAAHGMPPSNAYSMVVASLAVWTTALPSFPVRRMPLSLRLHRGTMIRSGVTIWPL